MSEPKTVEDLIREGPKKKAVKNPVASGMSNVKLPPGPNKNSDEADFILNEKVIYKKLVKTYIPKYGPIITLYKDGVPMIFVNNIDIGYELFVRRFSKEVSGRQPNYGGMVL